MVKRLIAGYVIFLMVLTGCQETVKKDKHAEEPMPVVGNPADYIVRAIDVTGGSAAW